MVEIRTTREERGAAQGQDNLDKFMCWGVPFSSIYRGRGGEATLEEGAALGGALWFPSTWWGATEGGRKLPPRSTFPTWASLVQVLPPHLGLPSERGSIDIKFILLILIFLRIHNK